MMASEILVPKTRTISNEFSFASTYRLDATNLRASFGPYSYPYPRSTRRPTRIIRLGRRMGYGRYAAP